MSEGFGYWVILGLTFLLSYLGTFGVRALALARGWVALPKADRWHQKPTALHGGVGIFLAFLTGSLLLLAWFPSAPEWFQSDFTRYREGFLFQSAVVLAGTFLMFLVGLVDDFFHLKPGMKLLGELVAVSVVIFLGIGYRITPFPWFDLLFSYLWFVGIVNAVNLLDNMDGVSSGVVIIATAGLCMIGVFGYTASLPFASVIGGVLMMAILGFWLHNRPPAKIFMGDSGSLVIGFLFACLTLPSSWNAFYIPGVEDHLGDNILQMLIAVTLAGIPILDTTLVTVTRLMRGQSPSVGGKDHSTHRLAHSGLTHWQTLAILYGFSAGCAAVALLMAKMPELGIAVFSTSFLVLCIAAAYLASVRIQVAPIKREGWQQLVTSITYRVPLIKMVMDVILIAVAFQVAYLVRFDFRPDPWLTAAMHKAMPMVVLSCLSVNFVLRVYDFSWRSASARDIHHYAMAALFGTLLSLALVTLATSFGLGYSRSAYIIFGLLYFLMLTASRFSYRLIDDLLLRLRLHQSAEGKIPLLIVGSGQDAKVLLDEVVRDAARWGNYRVVGLVDTQSGRSGRRINGLPVKEATLWVPGDFDSQPEILLADDALDAAWVHQFARSLGDHLRIRRYTRKIVDLS
jgi:UDP-GlcNAc:undecaprenyl-phosphate GlcNAc-1-phosphate transferase